MNYLEVENNDLHFATKSDFEKAVLVFGAKNIPYQVFDNRDQDGYFDKYLIVDKSNKAFLSLKIGIVEATHENLVKVKIRKELKRIRQIFNETAEAINNNNQFGFTPYDSFLAWRLGMARKKELELINQLSEL